MSAFIIELRVRRMRPVVPFQERVASLGACAREGYWHCAGCERVTEPKGEIFRRCGRCGSKRIHYYGPVL